MAYDALAATTYDGRVFDFVTGLLSGPAWTFSAASKESLHIPLLAMAVAGNPLANLLYSRTEVCIVVYVRFPCQPCAMRWTFAGVDTSGHRVAAKVEGSC